MKPGTIVIVKDYSWSLRVVNGELVTGWDGWQQERPKDKEFKVVLYCKHLPSDGHTAFSPKFANNLIIQETVKEDFLFTRTEFVKE